MPLVVLFSGTVQITRKKPCNSCIVMLDLQGDLHRGGRLGLEFGVTGKSTVDPPISHSSAPTAHRDTSLAQRARVADLRTF